MREHLPVALATTIAILASLQPASAQDTAELEPETPPTVALGVWRDPATQARRLELARIEMRVAERVRAQQPAAALELLEGVAAANLAADEDSLIRLIGTTATLAPASPDVGWLYAGIPLVCAGGVALIVSGYVDGFGAGDDWSLLTAYGLGGAVFVTGVALLIVGLVEHTFDAERRAFLGRRRDVLRAFRDARRALRAEW